MNSLARAGVLALSEHITAPLPIQVVDLLSGWSCATQICAALLQMKTQPTKTHTVIDVSMYDAALGSTIMQASKVLSAQANNLSHTPFAQVSNGKDMYVYVK